MQKMFRFFLISGRKRRRRTASVALWLLRQLRDAEKDEALRNSDILDGSETGSERLSRREYAAIEEECLCCEYAQEALESAIEDIECAY